MGLQQVLADAANFFRRLSSARPKPFVRKAVIHLGMPKAGSTSIQLALQQAQDTTLVRNRVWFAPPNDAFNDWVIYDALVADDLDGLRRYVQSKMEATVNAGADVVIFSAERLFTIDDVQRRIAKLASIVQHCAAEVSFVLVAREIRDFLRSYITQMIYNGQVTLDDPGLAEWMIDQTGLISTSGFRVDILPLDVQDSDRNIAERLVSVSTGRDCDIALTRTNVTPFRSLIYALTEGLVARMRAIGACCDINGAEMDSFRTAFATAYDNSVYATSDPGEVYRVLQRLNKLVEDQIEAYIDCCLEECPVEKLAFYDEIMASGPIAGSSAIDAGPAVEPDPTISAIKRSIRGTEPDQGSKSTQWSSVRPFAQGI